MKQLLIFITFFILKLRYKITIKGLDKIKERKSILFLANHPALIDPVLLYSVLYKEYKPRALVDEFQIERYPFLKYLALWLGLRIVSNIDRYGVERRDDIKIILSKTIKGLKQGENLLLYPAGHLKREYLEHIKAASAVEEILKEIPDVHIVLIRQNGLWGSIFSWGSNSKNPNLITGLLSGLKHLLLNGIFFMPKRIIEYEFMEPQDFPKTLARLEINKYLETFYNQNAWKNRYVPYYFWKPDGPKQIPEPEYTERESNLDLVPKNTKQEVIQYLSEHSGIADITPETYLATDLGMDSIRIAELIIWLEQKFGFAAGNPDSLQKVSDVMLAASGKGVVTVAAELRSFSKKWFKTSASDQKPKIPSYQTIAEIFLKQAKKKYNKIIIADQNSGLKTYRDILTSILILIPIIKKLKGKHIGIVLPASAGACIIYLAVMFSGKIPVMLNWAGGIKSINDALSVIDIPCILVSNVFLKKIQEQGFNPDSIKDRFIFLEDIRQKITFSSKITSLFKSYFYPSVLKKAEINETAVILFTSGSETKPKAVPLTHQNILTNIRDVLELINIHPKDRLLGILPPFHSFGLTVTIILPLCLGIRTVFHPNPMEAVLLGNIISAYKCSFLVGTPTLLNNIMRVTSSEQLKSLRIAITGAEKCSKSVYALIEKRCPDLKILEGYGVTECSPVISGNYEDNPIYYSIGKILPSYQYVIVNHETMKKVKPGKMGLLLVRGPSVFKGYLNYQGKSPFITFEGKEWYETGDLVYENNDHALFFCGRLKRFIKLGGEMISLPAIEMALTPYFATEEEENPSIAVLATEDQAIPEIVLFSTVKTDCETANKYLRKAGLSILNNIRRVIQVPEIPLLGNGKIDYPQLQARIKPL
ncbi:AMP-binding protein [Candidatus Margulisiibacteriota bacterium]